MDLKDWLIVSATILGPIFAVQAQKWVERFRERRQRKLWIFHSLMGSRADRTSAQHVQALNMIDLAFYGSSFFGMKLRSRREQAVLDSWKEYLDHLNTQFNDAGFEVWSSNGVELFINLLMAMSRDMGFSFDRVQIKKGVYSPVAHGTIAQDIDAIRTMAREVLEGRRSIKMDIMSVPPISAKPDSSQRQVDNEKQAAPESP
jgi:hypothetical protein